MAAYVIVEIKVKDPVAYENYKKLTPASIAAFGGRFIARGGQTWALEGDWKPERMVMLEFPNAERAKEWWNSNAYSEAKSIRQRSAETKMILVEGV